MGIKVSKYGEWTKAGVVLQALKTQLYPFCEAKLREDGEIVLTKMKEHIEKQDLNWTPLSPVTIRLKKGNTDVYIETGYLKDNLRVRKIKSLQNNVTVFVGASPWVRHKPSGEKMSDLMVWLEYGTDHIPPRPLVRETWDELKPVIKAGWADHIEEFIGKVGK